MNRQFLIFAVLLFSAIFSLYLIASEREHLQKLQVEKTAYQYSGTPASTLLNINNLSMWIRNDGYSARSPMGEDGVVYPRGTAGTVYTDGLIWGGYVRDNSPTLPRKRVGGQSFRVGTVPGRIISAGIPEDPNLPHVRIYRIRKDYQTVSDDELHLDASELNEIDTSQVTQNMIDAVRAQYAKDWLEWSAEHGAPFYDLNNNGIYEPAFGEEPGLANADQVIWFVCNDLDSMKTIGFHGSPPIGIELQVTFWGFNDSGPVAQTGFRRYRLINKSGYKVDSMFVAQYAEVDLGDWTEDLVGCDSLLSLGYVYNGFPTDSEYQQFSLVPPALGYGLLEGPMVPSPGDTAIFDLKKRPDYKNLSMTSFYYDAAGNTWSYPLTGGYEGTIQWYNILNGFLPFADSTNLIPFRHYMGPDSGNITKYPLNGDPFLRTGDIDGLWPNIPPSNRQLAICSGPFTFLPGDTQEVVVAVIGGISSDYLSSINELKQNAIEVQDFYNSLIQTPVGIDDIAVGHHLKTLELFQNYPNPFNPKTTISYRLAIGSEVELNIYNLLGQHIRTLIIAKQSSGTHEIEWDGRDEFGSAVSSGIYIYRLKANGVIASRKMILAK